MRETFFIHVDTENKWVEADNMPFPPNYTPLKKNMASKQPEVFCKYHNTWEKIISITKNQNTNEKVFVSECRSLTKPPYIINHRSVTYAYSMKFYNDSSFISFSSHSVHFFDAKKVKKALEFTLSAQSEEVSCLDRNFNIYNDDIFIPEIVYKKLLGELGLYFKKCFGIIPTCNSKTEMLTSIIGYLKYPFNANLFELQKFSGIKKFKIAKSDSLNENKMYQFLNIKPSKTLRKTYQEYPFSPIILKFLKTLGFKDQNLINKELKNQLFMDFLNVYMGRFDDENDKIVFVGDFLISFFIEKSMELNKEHTVLNALKTCMKTAWETRNLQYSPLMDSLQNIQNNIDIIPEGAKKEIFHDGITERTHDNLSHMLQSIKKGQRDAERKEPFDYSPGDLSMEYAEIEQKTGKEIVKFYLPRNAAELENFGDRMHNCVGWGLYTDSVRNGKCRIVAMYLEGRATVCIEINPQRNIVQCLGVSNTALNVGLRKIVLDWASKKGIGNMVL